MSLLYIIVRLARKPKGNSKVSRGPGVLPDLVQRRLISDFASIVLPAEYLPEWFHLCREDNPLVQLHSKFWGKSLICEEPEPSNNLLPHTELSAASPHAWDKALCDLYHLSMRTTVDANDEYSSGRYESLEKKRNR